MKVAVGPVQANYPRTGTPELSLSGFLTFV